MVRRRVAISLLLWSAAIPPLAATDYIVTRYDDPIPDACAGNDCSLREAVIAANANANVDQILLSAGTYTLSLGPSGDELAATGDLDLKQPVTIIGPGATMTTIDAASLDRHFDIYATGIGGTIQGVTLTGGNVGGSGTSVYVEGLAVGRLDQVTLTGNGGTGQLLLVYGQLTVQRSLITGNAHQALTLASSPSASALFENTTVADNQAPELQLNGGGASLTIRHCTLKNATSVLLLNGGSGAVATVSNSIISGICGLTNSTGVNSLGGNIESTGDICGFDAADDQVDVTAEELDLGTLDDHGGPTKSFAPGAASVALGAGNTGSCADEDQRGLSRDTGNCDSGSVEFHLAAPETPIFHDGFLQGNANAWTSRVGI